MIRTRKTSLALWIGLLGIIACELLLLAHVQGWTEWIGARLVRANMTPLAWLFYLVFAAGLLTTLDRRPWLRRWRNRFWACWLWSVTAWCFFDGVNFYLMTDVRTGLRAWEYLNMPEDFADRLLGYLIAFGAIAPGMFLSAEVFMRLGLHRLRTAPHPKPPLAIAVLFVLGLFMTAVPVFVGGPISNLGLWTGTLCVLDPINMWLGRPSFLDDWSHGRFGRTVSLGLGGLWCGFLWEFWNYWAGTKWVYHLPFLGVWEQYRYFEMPLLGLTGFIAFGVQTWVMWQTTLLVLAPFVEAERGAEADEGCTEVLCF